MNGEAIRILVLTDGLAVGGSERQLVELLKGLRRSGRFAPLLAVLDRGGDLEPEAAAVAADVLRLRRRMRFDWTPALALIGQAREAGVCLIHAVGWMSGLAAVVAARSLRLPVINGSIRSAPAVLTVRDRVSRWCARRSEAIVSNTRGGLDALKLRHHPRARVIENGIDLARFDGIVPENASDASICMVGNFSQYKDHLTLLRAMPYIRAAVPHARLVLVGRDAGTLADARRVVDQLGIGAAVRFVTDTHRPEPLIAGSTVCVSCTHGEGMSNAVMEYMALRKPVVASACQGNATLVRDGETAVLVPLKSPELLATAVVELLRDPQRAQRMGAQGRRRIEEHYSLGRLVAEYEALYDELLQMPPPAR